MIKLFSILLIAGILDAQEAMEILRKTEDLYRSLDSYQVVMTTSSDQVGKANRHIDTRARLSFRKPNLFRVESLDGHSIETWFDGEHSFTLNRQLKEYVKIKEPTGVGHAAAHPEAARLVSTTVSAKILREETLVVDGRRIDCWVIDRQVKPDFGGKGVTILELTLWIAKNSGEILKETRRSEWTTPFTGKVDSTTTMLWGEAQLNPDLPENFFTFLPPDGVREVKSFSAFSKRRTSPPMERAPEFTLRDTNGVEHSLTWWRGKVVLLNFWATWCGPCRDEMPFLELLHRMFKTKDLVVIGINDEDAEIAKTYLKDNGYSFVSLVDMDGKVKEQYGVSGFPTTFLIDRDGKVVLRNNGATGTAALKTELQKLNIW